MIVYKTGNILDDDADWLVNPVNCVGVMGAGLAKQFKEKFQRYFLHYKDGCEDGNMLVGTHYEFFQSKWGIENERNIISFPTKKHWKDKTDLAWIECGLNSLYKHGPAMYSIAFPKLGCGLGGLDWEAQVKPLMEKFAKKIDNIEVRVYV